MTKKSANSKGSLDRLVRRSKRLLADIDAEGYVLSLVTPGGQPVAILHPKNMSLECDSYCASRPGVYTLGSTGVGDMIAL